MAYDKNHQAGAAAAAGRSAYETKVGVEAVVRSGGKNPQLKGVVHEILYRDSLTMAPKNLASGAKGVLSKSVTAVRDDVLLKQGGSVVGRAQLKDAVASADKVARQAASGKYAGTKLMGTKETVAAYEKAAANLAKNGTKVTQKMTSTGISSADTSRIAAQTIGGSLKGAQLGKAALASSGTGAALSGAIEAVSSAREAGQGRDRRRRVRRQRGPGGSGRRLCRRGRYCGGHRRQHRRGDPAGGHHGAPVAPRRGGRGRRSGGGQRHQVRVGRRGRRHPGLLLHLRMQGPEPEKAKKTGRLP